MKPGPIINKVHFQTTVVHGTIRPVQLQNHITFTIQMVTSLPFLRLISNSLVRKLLFSSFGTITINATLWQLKWPNAERHVSLLWDTNNTSSVNIMLLDLDWWTLESRRTKLQLDMFYKIVNDLVDIGHSIFLVKTKVLQRSQHNIRYFPFSTRTGTFKFSLNPDVYHYMELQ